MRTHALLLLSFAAAGCAFDADPEAAPSQVAITMSSADAARVLDLVNYPGATQAVLDDDAGLDARAAANIALHRAGADGVFPSADDDAFDDLAELDAVPYVGDTAFEKLRAYAALHPAPAAESVEGVLFRGWESEIVTWGVNTVDFEVLDGMLDARAAQSLLDGRPYASVTEMGPRAYVGGSALDRLRREAAAWWSARSGAPSLAGTFDGVAFDEETARVALEIANDATRDEMVANGVYASGASAIVGNRPYADLASVAAVGGVGTSTMQGLHDYAASGAWSAEPSEPTEPSEPSEPSDPPALPDENCAFGLRYRDIGRNGATVIVARRVLDPASSTNATQRAQLVAAVQVAYSSVATVSQALAAVDENIVNQVELWDASNRRAYTAYEYGAGDNSYGAIFEHGTTNVASLINDGDLYECTALWGDEMRPCERSVDCAEGLTCFGSSADVPTGRCLDLDAEEDPAEGSSCVVESGCGPATGLVCAGAATWGEGVCVPAWMRGHFDSTYGETPIPDDASGGVVLDLPVYGLASVDTDVRIDLVVSHPRISDLRITLTNPATAEVVIFDGAGQTGSEVYLRDALVRGFSGDEQVNGVWQLRVVDRAGGSTGSVYSFGLTITSRWD